MTISEKGLALIKSQEGCVLHPYKDQAGIPTIGWGNTRYEYGQKVTMKDPPITQQRADELLHMIVVGVAEEVDGLITDQVNQNQFDALVDFAYNAGTGALKGSTLRKRVNANPSDPTIRDAFMMWTKIHNDKGELVELPVLKGRRKDEADLYFSA